MCRQKTCLLCLLLAFLYSSCEKNAEITIEPINQGRTLVVYLVADNSISSSLYTNVKDIVTGLELCKQKGEVIIYWDGHTGDPELLKYKVDAKGNVSQEQVLRTYQEQNSVDPEVMTNVFNDIFRLSPSESYGLIMGSHGLSWLPESESKKSTRTFGDDKGEEMEISLLNKVLSGVIAKPFDFLLFDACLMSSMEVLYELRNVAEYIIASPSEILAKGFPYSKIMPLLISDKLADYTRKVAEEFIQYYDYEFVPRWGTIAVVKCNELEPLAKVTKDILLNNSSKLEDFEISQLQRYDRTGLRETNFAFDFEHFIRLLAAPEEYAGFNTQLEKTIIYKDMVENSFLFYLNKDNYSGVANYVMQPDKTYLNDYFKTLSWYSASGWDVTNWN